MRLIPTTARRLGRVVTIVAALHATPLPASLQAQTTPITLADAILRGRSSGVQASLARLSVLSVEARRAQRGSDYLPNISGNAVALRQTLNLSEFGLSFPGSEKVTDPFTIYRFRLGAEQLIFSKSVLDKLQAAKDTAIAAGFDANRVGDIVAAAAGAAWLRLASAEETVRARSADSATAQALLEIASAQVDAGTAPRIDRTRSEMQVAAGRSRMAIARNERDRARLDLARILDLPVTTPLITAGDPAIFDAMPTEIDSAVALAKARRQDLAAERQRTVVLEQSLRAIKNEFWPTLGLSATGGTSGRTFDDLAGTYSVGVGLSWPIFDGARRSRRADEQRIRIDAQQLRLHDMEAQVEVETRQAALDLASARSQILIAEERLRLADQVLVEARERFVAGVTGSVETTTAQAEVTTARDGLIQARVAVGAAQVGAARALGLLDQTH